MSKFSGDKIEVNPAAVSPDNANPVKINKQNLSPCIRNCCLNEGDICLGCFRSLSEIIGWQNKSLTEQQSILVNCAQRKESTKG